MASDFFLFIIIMKRTFILLLSICLQLLALAQNQDKVGSKVITTTYELAMTDSPEIIFAKSLLTVYGNGSMEKWEQMKVDPGKLTFEDWFKIEPDGNGSNKIFGGRYSYGGKIEFSVSGNVLRIQLSELYTTRNGILSSTSKIEDNSISKSEKKNQKLKEAEVVISSYIKSLLGKIMDSNVSISTAYWDNIVKGDICVGMTRDDCRIAKGNPNGVFESGTEGEEWHYGLYYIVYFRQGKVYKIFKV